MLDFISDSQKVFFSGICGISMCGLATLTKLNGYDVLGSDTHPALDILNELEKNGIKVMPFHDEKNIDCDVFVYSSAIAEDNPELVKARQIGAKIFSRAEYLGKVTDEYRVRIGISGTHGKSTVSGMCKQLFLSCGCDVSAFIGAKDTLGSTFCVGDSDTVIFEACEYRRSFLNFKPSIGVILNIERDHTDCYPTLESEIADFSKFAQNSERTIISLDDKNSRKINHISPFYFSIYDKNADIYAKNLKQTNGCFSYTGVVRGKSEFEALLCVPGIHNVQNSLAAMSAAILCGLDLERASRSLSEFCGMKRRFEYIGTLNGAKIYDDYAHHPTEIRATLSAARCMGFEKVYCAFQSHTYSRTQALFDDFCTAFVDADAVFITDIYAARESNDLGISGKILADSIPNGVYIGSFFQLAERLRALAEPNTVIITLGAGELDTVARSIYSKQKKLP